MNETEYLNKVKDILIQWDEGCVTEHEAFNAILFYSVGVEATPERDPNVSEEEARR